MGSSVVVEPGTPQLGSQLEAVRSMERRTLQDSHRAAGTAHRPVVVPTERTGCPAVPMHSVRRWRVSQRGLMQQEWRGLVQQPQAEGRAERAGWTFVVA
jgi:hypothetical protein